MNAAANKVSSKASDIKNSTTGQGVQNMTQSATNTVSSTASDLANNAKNHNLISDETAKSISNGTPSNSDSLKGHNPRETTQKIADKVSSTTSDVAHQAQNQHHKSTSSDINKDLGSPALSHHTSTQDHLSSKSSAEGLSQNSLPSHGTKGDGTYPVPYATHTYNLAPSREQTIWEQ